MKRLYIFATSVAVVGFALAVACGGSSETPDLNGQPPDAASSSGQPPTDGSSGNNSSGEDGSDGTPSGDAGSDAQQSSSGATSNPAKISCNVVECNVGPQACCIRQDGGTCIDAGATCDQGVKAPCDEAADCQNGQKCCASVASRGTSCAAACGALEIQVCRTTAECGNSGPCSEKTCTFPGGPTFKVFTCGAPPAPFCQ